MENISNSSDSQMEIPVETSKTNKESSEDGTENDKSEKSTSTISSEVKGNIREIFLHRFSYSLEALSDEFMSIDRRYQAVSLVVYACAHSAEFFKTCWKEVSFGGDEIERQYEIKVNQNTFTVSYDENTNMINIINEEDLTKYSSVPSLLVLLSDPEIVFYCEKDEDKKICLKINHGRKIA
jgi:hypothetical protein